MNREEFIKKWVLFEDGQMVKDLDELLSLPPAEGAEQRMRVRNILQDFYRRGEYELEQAEEDIMRLFQPQQPTVEGAETIKQALCDDIEKSLNSAKMKHILSEDGEVLPFVDFMSTGDTIAEGREEIENIVEQIYFDMDSWPSLATLHAQRIADKMVEEKCKKCKYRGLPDSINEALNSGDGVYRP